MRNSFLHRFCIFVVLIGLFTFSMPAKAQTEELLRSREEFRECGLGIFIHWGIYSLYGDSPPATMTASRCGIAELRITLSYARHLMRAIY